MDGSGLILHSPEWLAYWKRQVSLYETGDENVRLTLEGVRAVMQATPDDYFLERRLRETRGSHRTAEAGATGGPT